MKVNVLAILLVQLALINVSARASEDIAKTLVGTWITTAPDENVKTTYNPDGKYRSVVIYNNGSQGCHQWGTWKIEGDNLFTAPGPVGECPFEASKIRFINHNEYVTDDIAFHKRVFNANVCNQTDRLIEQYVAMISTRDHFNSNGDRLTDAASIIRQDRANYHKYGLRDPGESGDSYFANAANRDLLERLLNRGASMNSSVKYAIVNGNPAVLVRVFRNNSGQDYVEVSIVD